MSLMLMMRHHALLAAAAKKGGGIPMPDGYEHMDFLEVTGNGVYSNSIWNPSGTGSYRYRNIRGTDLIECEYDAAVTGSSININFIGFHFNNKSCGINPYGSKNGKLYMKYLDAGGGGYTDTMLDSWSGEPTRIKFYTDENYYLLAEFNGRVAKSRKQIYHVYSDDDSRNDICTIGSAQTPAAGSKLRYWRMKDRTTGEYKVHFVAARRKSDGAPAIVELVSQDVYNANSTFWRAGNDA